MEPSQYPIVVVNWLTRGIAGAINVLERAHEDGVVLSLAQYAAIASCVQRLDDVLGKFHVRED